MNAFVRTKLSQLQAPIACHYQNDTASIQIVCGSNTDGWCFERTIFPGQALKFEAPPEAVLEVRTGAFATAIVSDRISCSSLKVVTQPSSLNERIKKRLQSNSLVDRIAG